MREKVKERKKKWNGANAEQNKQTAKSQGLSNVSPHSRIFLLVFAQVSLFALFFITWGEHETVLKFRRGFLKHLGRRIFLFFKITKRKNEKKKIYKNGVHFYFCFYVFSPLRTFRAMKMVCDYTRPRRGTCENKLEFYIIGEKKAGWKGGRGANNSGQICCLRITLGSTTRAFSEASWGLFVCFFFYESGTRMKAISTRFKWKILFAEFLCKRISLHMSFHIFIHI